MKTSSKFEKYNFEYLETSAKQLISKYMEKTEFESEITSSYICIQNNQVFVFFDYKPLNGNPIISEMPQDVIERNLFYGYAKIEKKFNHYNVVDFQVGNYDNDIGLKGASGTGTSCGQTYRYFGKILDDNVEKIEFYDADILAATYYVGDKDFYFVELNSSLGNITRRYYDNENRLLYD